MKGTMESDHLSEITVLTMTRSVSTFVLNRSIIDDSKEILVGLVIVFEKQLDSSHEEKAI